MPSHKMKSNKKGSGQLQRAKGNAKPAHGDSALGKKRNVKGRRTKLSG